MSHRKRVILHAQLHHSRDLQIEWSNTIIHITWLYILATYGSFWQHCIPLFSDNQQKWWIGCTHLLEIPWWSHIPEGFVECLAVHFHATVRRHNSADLENTNFGNDVPKWWCQIHRMTCFEWKRWRRRRLHLVVTRERHLRNKRIAASFSQAGELFHNNWRMQTDLLSNLSRCPLIISKHSRKMSLKKRKKERTNRSQLCSNPKCWIN